MAVVKFYRKGHIITNLKGDVVFTGTFANGEYPSINAAKRESRKLQELYGAGCLRRKS
jgi:hypothetical protein